MSLPHQSGHSDATAFPSRHFTKSLRGLFTGDKVIAPASGADLPEEVPKIGAGMARQLVYLLLELKGALQQRMARA